MAFFNGAKNVTVNGSSFVVKAGHSQKGGLHGLVAEVAPNAIFNAGGRADEVRCFPGTRKEVIARLEELMDDDSPGKKRMIWLSGPAGAGKSAILQTVAERCSEIGRQAANFFFFRGDRTRSHSKPLVATLVYQLRRFYPTLDEPLLDYLEKDPLICSTSIETQFKQLISSPIQTIQQSTPIQQQIVIIIDGLDECNDERNQDQILVALHALAHAEHSPFRILVSSRAESHLVMSFNRLGSSVESMFLDDNYKPKEDIHLFVVAKFAEIKKVHHLARTLGHEWPGDAYTHAITKKSSGQFLYAATVMRYIQFSSSSPALSLVTILEMPPSINHNPLAQLDAVYSYIFSKVKNIRAVKLILCARHCTTKSKEMAAVQGPAYLKRVFRDILQLVGYTDVEVESFFADLVAIIKVVPNSKVDVLEFYHASLEDYLVDKSRSKIYYFDDNDIAAELSAMCLRNIYDAHSIRITATYPLRRVQKPTAELSRSLMDASTQRLSGIRVGNGVKNVFLSVLVHHMERLYWKHDKTQFKSLLRSWIFFAYRNNVQDELSGNQIQLRNLLALWYFKQYRMIAGAKYARGL